MQSLQPFLPRYRAALASFLSTDDELARERALFEATEIGKAVVAEQNPTIDLMREMHRVVLQGLLETWRDSAEAAQRAAVERVNRGDASDFGIAFLVPQELAQLRQHEQRWRREQGQLLALFAQTDDLIVVLDAGGRIESVNPAFTRLTSWTPLEAATQMAAAWRGPLPLRATHHHRLEQPRRDGSTVMVEWSISPIFGDDGELLSRVCIGRDVSRQQRIDEGLRENDKLRAVATLAGGIAHDFNNLLGSMLGLAELCALDAVPASRQARNLSRIRQACVRAATLVRQLLDFSRQTPPTLQRLGVGEWLAHSEGLLRAALPRHLRLTVSVEADGLIQIDLIQLDQVLLNIVRNAGQAMGTRAGCIRIVADFAEPANAPRTAARSPGAAPGGHGHVRVRIIDQGEGMPAEILDKIFEPFFTTKPVGEGTGLGLAAAHGIVSLHGGVIEVQSQPGQGTTLSVFLPLAEVAVIAG